MALLIAQFALKKSDVLAVDQIGGLETAGIIFIVEQLLVLCLEKSIAGGNC